MPDASRATADGRRAHDLSLLRRRLRRRAGRATATAAGTVTGRSRRIRRISAGCARKARRWAETLALDGRLLHPMIGDRRVSWDEALDAVADGFRRVIERHGPDAVAFYVSGQLLTEDYYVANKLMKGFIGSANIDTNSRLCMASSVAGHKRAFGADVVPGCYEDLDEADLIVLVGSNAAWCHPVLFQRMIRNRAAAARGSSTSIPGGRRRRKRRTCSSRCAAAATRSCSMACSSIWRAGGRIDRAYIDAHTEGYRRRPGDGTSVAPDVAATARACGLPADDVERFFAWFAETDRVVTCYSQGVNQSVRGTDKVNAIINCHLATGRIGRPGMGPLSLTGQPNAMGGREVGGLANQLAAHMGFDRGVGRSGAPVLEGAADGDGEGLKAVDMFDAVDDGRIKALWVMATNPVVSLPRADAVRAGRSSASSSSSSPTTSLGADTVARAPIRLPACGWGEKDGTVTNSERRISRQRAFLPSPGEARPDWWIVCEVARAPRLRRRLRLPARRRRSSPSMRRSRRSRTTAAAPSIWAAWPRLATHEYDALRADPVAAATRSRRGRTVAVLRRRRLFHRRRQGPLRAVGAPPDGERDRAPFRCASTPAASATSGTR